MDRVGKLFLVLDAANRRCLCCDGVFTRQDAPNHAQLPCRPAQKASMEEPCELPCTHELAH
jgi:hypothetical protein